MQLKGSSFFKKACFRCGKSVTATQSLTFGSRSHARVSLVVSLFPALHREDFPGRIILFLQLSLKRKAKVSLRSHCKEQPLCATTEPVPKSRFLFVMWISLSNPGIVKFARKSLRTQ